MGGGALSSLDVMELSPRKKLCSLTANNLRGSSLFVFEHKVEEFSFFLEEVEGRAKHLCLKVGESSTFSSSWAYALFHLFRPRGRTLDFFQSDA